MGKNRAGFVAQISLGCTCFHGVAVTSHHALNGRRYRVRPRHARVAPVGPVSAVQVNAVSGGHDGEVTENEPEKSYSVGVTIVSGFDPELRRRVIENIVAGCVGKRVVVVTASGITSTIEQDGAESPPTESSGTDAETAQAAENLEGWLSCSSYDEMAEVIAKLAASRDYDYIVAEGATATSIGPQQIALLLKERGRAALRVDTLVSVLDGDRVLNNFQVSTEHANDVAEAGNNGVAGEAVAANASSQPEEASHALDQSTTPPMVIVSLVENANVVVINRENAEGAVSKLEPVQSIISVLNRRASVVPATDCSVPVQQVVNTNLYDSDDMVLSASWKLVLLADRAGQKNGGRSVPKSVKDATFVYRARRPFHPERLYSHIRDVQTFAGVIRSTGKIWLATRMVAPLEWNQAGESATLQVGPRFWASRPEEEWPKEEGMRDSIMTEWDTQFGDRETELVFVGMGIDKERLQGLLDGCLLQDEEMVFTNLWENFKDPFIEWVPLIEDDEDEEEPEELEVAPPPEVAEVQTVQTAERVTVEGAIDSADIPEDVVEKAKSLDALAEEYLKESDSTLTSIPGDDGHFDKDSIVLASGEEKVADDILQQMPIVGLPVTIVTGFLGSGKTTLLNYILTAEHGLRVAVLVNEFGEIDIDSQLVKKGDWSKSDDIIELANGCICCNISESFINSVRAIVERKDVDYLIVETSGVADPVPVLNSLLVSDVANDVRIDSVLTVVGADSFDNATPLETETAKAQISSADTILLSKTDIASPESTEKVVNFIQSILPSARILRSQRGRIPIEMILDVRLRPTPSPTKSSTHQEHDHGHDHASDHSHSHDHEHEHSHDHDHEHGPDCGHDHSHSHSNHLEEDGFMTTSFRSDIPLIPEAFMEKFLQQLPKDVYRSKGLLNFYGYPQRIIFQLSGRRYAFEEDEWPEDMAPSNQLVIIGRDLDVAELQQNLEECHVQLEYEEL